MCFQVDANVMVVMDSFALPVEGTETRVNAQAQGYEYMTAYIDAAKQVGRLENAIGWYHSHPGVQFNNPMKASSSAWNLF